MESIYILIGLFCGMAIGWFICLVRQKPRILQLEMQIQELNHRIQTQQQHFQDISAQAETMHLQALNAQERRHSEAMDALQVKFNETIEKTVAQVRFSTDTMMRQHQKEFAENSRTGLTQITAPLRDTIEQMKKALADNTEKQTAMGSEMKAHLESMVRHSIAAKESTDALMHAFSHHIHFQGEWGETVLDELLQSQGLVKGIHYTPQATLRDAEGTSVSNEKGNKLRPDVILHLDERREIIIDAKVSLRAYMDYTNADNDTDREKHLRAHVASLQKHVSELARRDYSRYVQPPKVSMDYVIMFVPHTVALWTALQAQPDLWRNAMDQNVFIADEQTLYAALRMVHLTWVQIAQAQNQEKVFALANEMLRRVGQFWKSYDEMGKSLQKIADSYEEGKRKITQGGHSICTTAQQLVQLGARAHDKYPLPEAGE